MTSRTVKSPAGEMVEIVPDEDWSELTGQSRLAINQWGNGVKPHLLRALWEHGEFTDDTGLTTRKVMKDMRQRFPDMVPFGRTNIMNLWRTPVNAPAVETRTKGKRTYSLKLVAMPQTWHRKLMLNIADSPSDPEPIPEPTQEDREAAAVMERVLMPQEPEPNGEVWTDADWEALQLDAPTVYEEPPPLELHIANQVAMSLLTTCVEIISAGSADTSKLGSGQRLADELQHSQHLLSLRLDENDKLRRQLREAGDSITALRHERDGLRSRLRQTERNLNEVLKGETAQAVNTEIQKRVDQFMRTPPTAKGE